MDDSRELYDLELIELCLESDRYQNIDEILKNGVQERSTYSLRVALTGFEPEYILSSAMLERLSSSFDLVLVRQTLPMSELMNRVRTVLIEPLTTFYTPVGWDDVIRTVKMKNRGRMAFGTGKAPIGNGMKAMEDAIADLEDQGFAPSEATGLVFLIRQPSVGLPLALVKAVVTRLRNTNKHCATVQSMPYDGADDMIEVDILVAR